MKSLIRKYCEENDRNWDKGLPYLLFAIRETPNESLGFSSFELMFTHEVRGPLKLVRDRCLNKNEEVGPMQYVTDVKDKLRQCRAVAEQHLVKAQSRQKKWYDKKTIKCKVLWSLQGAEENL